MMATSDVPELGAVLIIGGSGLLGRHIVKQLIEAKNTSKIIVLDINTSVNRVDGVHYETGSITSSVDVAKS